MLHGGNKFAAVESRVCNTVTWFFITKLLRPVPFKFVIRSPIPGNGISCKTRGSWQGNFSAQGTIFGQIGDSQNFVHQGRNIESKKYNRSLQQIVKVINFSNGQNDIFLNQMWEPKFWKYSLQIILKLRPSQGYLSPLKTQFSMPRWKKETSKLRL